MLQLKKFLHRMAFQGVADEDLGVGTTVDGVIEISAQTEHIDDSAILPDQAVLDICRTIRASEPGHKSCIFLPVFHRKEITLPQLYGLYIFPCIARQLSEPFIHRDDPALMIHHIP